MIVFYHQDYKVPTLSNSIREELSTVNLDKFLRMFEKILILLQ